MLFVLSYAFYSSFLIRTTTLGVARFLFNKYFTAGYLQGRTYDPNVAELCYVTYPNRIAYSLQQQETSNIDAWITFLPLNRTKVLPSDPSIIFNMTKQNKELFTKEDMQLMGEFCRDAEHDRIKEIIREWGKHNDGSKELIKLIRRKKE
jgi:hypothetical protein